MVDEYIGYDNSVIPKFNHTNLMVWVFQLFFDYMVCVFIVFIITDIPKHMMNDVLIRFITFILI
jgi:hypothetical protein